MPNGTDISPMNLPTLRVLASPSARSYNKGYTLCKILNSAIEGEKHG